MPKTKSPDVTGAPHVKQPLAVKTAHLRACDLQGVFS